MIYTLGPEGTFSDKAATLVAQHVGGQPARTFLPNISSVFDRTLKDKGSIGVVPIENSVAGTVHVVQDLLIRQPVWIEYEVQVPIAFKLLVLGAKQDVRRVFVHPVAERQCTDDLREQVPTAEVVFTDSNTDSAIRLLSEQDHAAAVVPVDYAPPEPTLRAFALRTPVRIPAIVITQIGPS